MEWFLLAIGLLVLCFGFVVFFGAPYLPTLNKQIEAALDLAGPIPLPQGKDGRSGTLLELGSGDGRVLIAAAERGWYVVGYELNPLLAAFSWLRTRRYGSRVRVVCGNFWTKQWPPHDVIFVFLLDKYMLKLDKKIVQNIRDQNANSRSKYHQQIKLVSFAFRIPGKKPASEQDGVALYEYR